MGVVTPSSSPTTAATPAGRTAEGSPLLEVVRWPALDATGAVDAVVTTRHGGVSSGPWATANLGLHVGDDPAAVVTNRSRAAASLGLPLDALVFAHQTHGAEVAVVTATDAGRGTRTESDALDGVDALVTTDGSVGLVIMVADCVPIVLVDPTAEVLGVVHAGWRGTVGGVVRATVAAMVGDGAAPERLVAGIGPSVRAEDYQVGSDVADGIVALLGDDPRSPSGTPVLRPDPPDPGGTPRWRCDLAGANAAALVACGVHPDNIHDTGHHSGDGAFFSDRVARPCGRFAVVARLRHHSRTVQ